MDAAPAMIRGRAWSRSAVFSASRRSRARSARPSSTCVRTMASSRGFSHGLATKSRAPRRIASTASSTLAQAVITTMGSVQSTACSRLRRSSPSCPEVVSRA